MKKLSFATITLLAGSVIFYACSKSSSNGSTNNSGSTPQTLSVHMTDAPAAFDSVFIDIAAVEAKIDTSSHKNDDAFGDADDDAKNDMESANNKNGDHDQFGYWKSLSFTPGLYNVFKLRNGLDTVLAKAEVMGTVRKIRFTLGTNSYVVKKGVKYPLILVNSSKNQFVYVSLHDEDRDNEGSKIDVWVDFDLGRSIIYKNGQYYLLPVLKPFTDAHFAELQGNVGPNNAEAVIKAFSNTDTAMALPNDDGFFKIRGLKSGSYSVSYISLNGYKDTTITGITVTQGQQVTLPNIILKK